jgi:hypothetical protein
MRFLRKRTRVAPATLAALDPHWVYDRLDRFVAATVPEGREWPVGVWDAENGKLVWSGGPACWLRDGTQLVALTGDRSQTLERRTWPGLELVSSCEVVPWACCNERVAASPRGDIAAVLWWHQTEGGFELVALDDRHGDRQLNRGYTTWESNLLGGPAFSPDGRFVAVTEGRPRWWESGRERGRLTVVDVATGAPHHYPISDDPPETVSDDGESERYDLLGPPHFVASEEVVLRPSFGREQRIAI